MVFSSEDGFVQRPKHRGDHDENQTFGAYHRSNIARHWAGKEERQFQPDIRQTGQNPGKQHHGGKHYRHDPPPTHAKSSHDLHRQPQYDQGE